MADKTAAELAELAASYLSDKSIDKALSVPQTDEDRKALEAEKAKRGK